MNLQIKGMPQKNQKEVAVLTASRCTEFLIGWMKRSGNALNLFVFPSNNKEHPNL